MKDLIAAAEQARKHAYAPYSQYAVGAAVRAANGKIYTGSNIENASYGLTICAERVALASAAAAGERQFEALAISAGKESPGMPCGACRQFMAEWFDNEVPVVSVSSQGQQKQMTFGELLPEAFGKAALKESER